MCIVFCFIFLRLILHEATWGQLKCSGHFHIDFSIVGWKWGHILTMRSLEGHYRPAEINFDVNNSRNVTNIRKTIIIKAKIFWKIIIQLWANFHLSLQIFAELKQIRSYGQMKWCELLWANGISTVTKCPKRFVNVTTYIADKHHMIPVNVYTACGILAYSSKSDIHYDWVKICSTEYQIRVLYLKTSPWFTSAYPCSEKTKPNEGRFVSVISHQCRGDSHHWQLAWLLNRYFTLTIKKIPKPHNTNYLLGSSIKIFIKYRGLRMLS